METWILVGIVLFLIFLIYSSHCDCRRGFSVGGITDEYVKCNFNTPLTDNIKDIALNNRCYYYKDEKNVADAH